MTRFTFSRFASVSLMVSFLVVLATFPFASVGQAADPCNIANFDLATIAVTAPRDIVSDDFNHDGKLDLATVNSRSSNNVAVLLGNGNGTFAAPTNFTGGSRSLALASGDFNGDSHVDLVTASEVANQGTLHVLFGNGAGGFGTRVPIFTSTQTRSYDVAVGDVNGDGALDLVFTNREFASVNILLNSGTGTFTLFKSYLAGIGPGFLVMRDFNADTKLDIAVANFRIDSNSNFGSVAILLGDGTGNFAAPTQFAVGSSPSTMAVGDFNGDSKLDLAVANSGSNNLSILIGDGAGQFASLTIAMPAEGPLSIVQSDFNGDGKIDLAVTHSQPGGVLVFSGNGSGGFTAVSNFKVVAVPNFSVTSAMVGGDFNSDGRPDLAAVTEFQNLVAVLSNSCGSAVPSVLQFNSPLYAGIENVGMGPQPTSFVVMRTGLISGIAGVDYVTADGTATAPADYTAVSGTVTFASGEVFKTISVPTIDDNISENEETFSMTLSNATGSATLGSPSTGVSSIHDNDTVQPATLNFSNTNYIIFEDDGSLGITVSRTGSTQGSSSVDYSTSDTAGSNNCNVKDGKASSRCDYLTTVGTLHFAANETNKVIWIPIVDDSYAEPDETFTISLSNPVGANLGSDSSATVNIFDNENVDGPNPIDQASFFVRQHYLDFLNREPDAAGLAFWSNQITSCGSDQACIEVRRINVSAAFFVSIEFQETGYLVERLYKSAYGDAQGTSNFGPTHQLAMPVIRFHEFLPDTQQIGKDVVVGVGDWEAKIEANKVAFIQGFVLRSRFTTAFPTTLTPAQFVDALYLNAGVTPSAAERTSVIGEFGGAGDTTNTAARARALRRVAENSTLADQEKNKAFVLMQYFGYMRRDPNASPDSDYSGYDFWLSKLNQFNGNFVEAEMVKAFITSGEYRERFGQ